MTAIKTTGELRQFLLEGMTALRDGKMDISTANTLQKMASQINESLYAELKAMALMQQLSQEQQPLGHRPLTDLRLIQDKKNVA